MSQLFLTNYSIIVIKQISKLNEDNVYCLGNESIIRNFSYIQEARYSFPITISRANFKTNSSTSRWKEATSNSKCPSNSKNQSC